MKRVPSLDEEFCPAGSCPDAADGERTGIVSTLVDAETSLGHEICLGSIRFLWASLTFVVEGAFFNCAIAASALRCTSFASSCRLSLSRCSGMEGDETPAFTEGGEGESVSRSERELTELSICGGCSTDNPPEPVIEPSTGCGDGDVRDCSESEAPNKARASAFFLRVALEGSVSLGVPATISVFSSVGGVGSLGRGACMLSTTESSRALAFDALSWGEARGGGPCCVGSYPCVRPVMDD